MLKHILGDKIKSRGLSIRAAASEIGVSHTTLNRILDDGNTDLDTVNKIADWAGVGMAELLGLDETDDIEVLVTSIPGLKEVLEEAVEKVKNKELSPSALADITSYARFRIGEKHGRSETSDPEKRKRPEDKFPASY